MLMMGKTNDSKQEESVVRWKNVRERRRVKSTSDERRAEPTNYYTIVFCSTLFSLVYVVYFAEC